MTHLRADRRRGHVAKVKLSLSHVAWSGNLAIMAAKEKKKPTVRDGGAERSADTRIALVLAAERLFGEEGIGAVSMRSINNAADQKNVSAVHYHFGSREAIMEAIFDHRMAGASARREGLLRALEESGNERDLRSLIGVAIWPLAEQITTAAQPNYFVRYLAQSHRMPKYDSWLLVRHKNRKSIAKIYLKIMRLVDDIPRPIVHTRLIMGMRHAIYALADLDRVIEARHPDLRDEMVNFYTNELIDMLYADLRTGMSAMTEEAYQRLLSASAGTNATLFGPDTLQAYQRLASRRSGGR